LGTRGADICPSVQTRCIRRPGAASGKASDVFCHLCLCGGGAQDPPEFVIEAAMDAIRGGHHQVRS
jgi:hypothetical protein